MWSYVVTYREITLRYFYLKTNKRCLIVSNFKLLKIKNTI